MNSKDNINKRKELLKACRYFDGSDSTQLTGNAGMLWFYEKCWYLDTLKTIETGEVTDIQQEILDEYAAAGLGRFELYDQTPISLKAFLFNRYGKTCSGTLQEQAESFKSFYLDHYFSLHADPFMKWNTPPMEERICQSCLNRLKDGSCEVCAPVEQSAALINNKCDLYLQRRSESV